MSDYPHDAASLVEWFTADYIIRRDGSRSERTPYMYRESALRLAPKIGKPPPHYGPRIDPIIWNVSTIWTQALDHNIFMAENMGWIDREGTFWTCGFTAHELLLHFLDVDINQAELAGWVRIGQSGAQCSYELSNAQMSTLLGLGMEKRARIIVDEAIGLPAPSNVRAAAVKPPLTLEEIEAR